MIDPKLLFPTLFALGLAACGSDEPEEHSLDEELCEHMKEGPAKAVTASAMAAQAADATAEHTRIDVALVDFSGMKGGYVRWEVEAAGDHVVGMGAVPFKILKATDQSVVALEKSEGPPAQCTEVAARHTVDLEVGGYLFELGPTTATMVSLVVEEAAHAHE